MNNSFSLLPLLIALSVGLAPLSVASAKERGGGEEVATKKEIERIYENFAEISATMLLSVRNVIAKNQELINRDPETGNNYFKGFVPAVAGSRIANDFSLRTGYKLKQTALRVRNPRNKADEWEERVLRILEKDRTKNGHGEITELHGKQVYRYMKPLYMEKECVMCHSVPEVMSPEVREFIENNYTTDKALGYKEGDLRGGISVIIPITEEFRP
ncbi:MAG: DUF3365 domain-containing protein [Planctomycetes bacterium]|nr:DUF3365 domain-containing protein [Planctomycetota bacterium]